MKEMKLHEYTGMHWENGQGFEQTRVFVSEVFVLYYRPHKDKNIFQVDFFSQDLNDLVRTEREYQRYSEANEMNISRALVKKLIVKGIAFNRAKDRLVLAKRDLTGLVMESIV